MWKNKKGQKITMNFFEEKTEKKVKMHKEHEEIFNKYKNQSNNGILIPDNLRINLEKTGRDLLPEKTVNYFLTIRSSYYANVIKNKIKDYTYMEWVTCIKEKILLEYALPIFSNVLLFYPMLSGIHAEWEILYEISDIDEKFWMKHRKWKDFFIRIMKEAINKEGIDSEDEYFYQYMCGINEFIKNS